MNNGKGPVAPLTQLHEEERIFQQTVREFAEGQVRPLVTEMDRRAELPSALLEKLFALGLMNIEIPPVYGGSGGSFFMATLAIEELARIDPAVAVAVDVQNILVNNALLRWGSADQQTRYLPALARDTVGAYALSEPGAGSDAFALSTRARLDGEDFIVNGSKLWITNGVEAGLYILFANARPGQGQRGITAFLVERESPGLSVGAKIDKLGIRASSTCEVVLEDVRVPRQNVIGHVGEGYDIAIETLNKGRIGIAAQMVGLAQGAFEAALAYARQRKQFGQPIANFQGVHFPLAEMATDIEAARLLVYNAARLVDLKAFFLHVRRPAAMAKYFASQVAEKVASQALEIFGGYGFASDSTAEKFYRDAKIGKIYEGTSNMQLRTIACTLLDTVG